VATSPTWPPWGPVLQAGPRHGDHGLPGPGVCLMEYVAALAGEPISDLPECTHPALAAVAWRVNDEISYAARQRLVSRAPALACAGPAHADPVDLVVLGIIADAGLRLDPPNRYFRRLRRRLDRRAVSDRATAPGALGRPAPIAHARPGRGRPLRRLAPVVRAMYRVMHAAHGFGLSGERFDEFAVGLLDECLAAVHPTSPVPGSHSMASSRTVGASA
jgi:hypothetical protein